MCLKIDKIYKCEENNRKFVYKLVSKGYNESFFRNFFSSAIDTRFVLGQKIESSRRIVDLSYLERTTNEVYHGFHVFLSLDAAIFYSLQERGNCGETFCVLKCAVDPKDHVADGTFGLYTHGRRDASAVYMSLTPIEVMPKDFKGF